MRDLLAYCRHILASLHAHGFPEAIIAGGAIRDLDNGMAEYVKDIDVVIFDRPNYLMDLKMAMRDFTHRVAVREEVANYLKFENVACVHEFKDGDSNIPVQVVVSREPRSAEEILRRHDFGICQIGFDGRLILKTNRYVDDKTNKQFTLVRCRDAEDLVRSQGRHARLTAVKYQWWPLVFDGIYTP